MAYSNRVSLDTDVIFLRTMFAFSTNNVPVSTNFIMAAGCNGQIIASDALRTLETYGIGYLPSTFSTFDGEILSVSLSVLSTGVTNSMLYSTQAYLLNNICSVQSNVEILSSYVLENVIPSSFSTVNQQIVELNSSFQGYVTSQAITSVQLYSTTAGLISYTDSSTSNLSTSVDARFVSYSNYVAATYTPLTMFYGLSTGVSTSIVGVYSAISTTNSNFVALSNYTRVTVQGLSTQVNAISNLVNTLSSQTVDPYYTIGQMSTMQNVRFGSNIQVSSITSNIYLRNGNVGIGTSNPTARLDVSGSAAITGNLVVDTNTLYVNATTNRVGIVNASPAYPLDVTGDINFTGTLRQNGTPYGGGGGTTNVLGILSTTNQVYFGSNITTSTINVGSGTLFASNGFVGIGTSTPTTPLDVSGAVTVRGQIFGQSGSAAAPAFVNANDISQDTGIFFPADGQVSIANNGNEYYRFSTNQITVFSNSQEFIRGNKSIKLNTITNASNLFNFGLTLETTNTNLLNGIPTVKLITPNLTMRQSLAPSGDYFSMAMSPTSGGNNTALVIDPSGQVGICGNPNADTALTVNGATTITGNLAVNTNTLYVDATVNRVGIVNASPGYTLDVAGDINFSGTLRQNGNPYGGGGGGAGGDVLGTISAANQVYFGSNITTSTMNLGSRTLFASNGVVGIGTSTPTTALDVSGAVTVRGQLFGQSGSAAAPAFVNINDIGQDTGLFFPADGQLSVTTNGTERTRITGTAIFSFCNRVESVGFNSNKSAILDAPATYSGDPNLIIRTNINDVSGGVPQIQMTTPSLTMKQFLVPATGSGFGVNDIYAVYMYPTAGGTNYALSIDASGQVGIRGNTTTDNALTVNGALNVTSAANVAGNLVVDTNTLYVNAATNRVGILCNAPSFAFDVNGNTNLNGRIFSQNGGAAAPAFGSVNDQDTGLFFPADGQVSITTNSAERARFNGVGLYMFSNVIESVGYNSNKAITIDAGATNTFDTTLTIRTNSSNTVTDGTPYITMQTSSLTMRNFLIPASGTGFGTYDRFKSYMYPTGGGTYNAMTIDASGQVGIGGDSASNYALNVNGALNVASNLSTQMLNVSTVYSYVSTPQQVAGTDIKVLGTSGVILNAASNIELFSTPIDVFSKYNLVNVFFSAQGTTNQPANNDWFRLRLDTTSITNNSNKFTFKPGPSGTWVTTSFNYYMTLGRDFTRTDNSIRLMIDYANLGGNGQVWLTYFTIAGIY